VLLRVITFAHFGTAFWQDILIILAHFPMCNVLQIQFFVFSKHQRIKFYHLQGNRLTKSCDWHNHSRYGSIIISQWFCPLRRLWAFCLKLEPTKLICMA
jgi:hypothetical protein